MILSSQLRPLVNRHRKSERGYVLLTLLLMVSLMTIAFLAVVPTIKFEIRRDQEDEMIHRGVQYSRAVRAYYKKFGRYPTRIEDLESTNNMRFLRKRYTDPINVDKATGKEKDFKFLHQQDIALNNGPVLGPTAGQLNAPTQGGFGSQGGCGVPQGHYRRQACRCRHSGAERYR